MSAKSKAVLPFIGHKLWHSQVTEKQSYKTHSPSTQSLSALPVVLFYFFLHVLSAVVFRSSRSIELQGLVAICQKIYTSSKLCGKLFYEATQQGVGDESRLLKRHTLPLYPLLCLSLAGSSLSLPVVPAAQVEHLAQLCLRHGKTSAFIPL